MATNDSLKSVENIVQLPSARRASPIQVPRAPAAQPVLFKAWVTVRDRAAATLLGGSKRLLLTGPAGTGKTVLIEHVARVLRAAGRTVIIQLPDADPAPPGPGVTLFVDEADRLSAPKIRQLIDDAAGTVVLIGLAPLTRRVAAETPELTLEPLGQADAQDYIAQWLVLNGRTSAELDSRAVRALVDLSGGVPRLLSTLLAAGSLLSRSSDAPIIQATHIQEAAALRSVLGPPMMPEIGIVERPRAPPHQAVWSALLTGIVLVGTGAAIAPRLFPAETDRLLAHAPPLIDHAARWLSLAPPITPTSPAQMAPPIQTAPPQPEPPPPPIQAAPAPPIPAPLPMDPVTEATPPPIPAPPPPPEPTASTPEPPPDMPRGAPPQTAEAPPELPAPAPVPEIKPVAVLPPRAVEPPLPLETIDILLRRGRQMLLLDDLSAARLLFQRAAEGGSPEAMVELGRTYDPAFVTNPGVAWLTDRAEALRWYGRAAERGSSTADRLLTKP